MEIKAQATADFSLDGFQAGFELNSNQLKIKEIKSSVLEIQIDEYLIEGKKIKISKAFEHSKTIRSGDVLFKIILNGTGSITDQSNILKTLESFPNELYFNETVYSLLIKNELDNNTNKFYAYPVQPNPFTEEASIRFEMPGSGMINLQIYDLTGKRLYAINKNCVTGSNEINLSRKDFKANGLLYYVLTSPFGSASERMFVIE